MDDVRGDVLRPPHGRHTAQHQLRARDMIYFTTHLQTVNYFSTIHC